MTHASPSVDPELLLAQASWVRSIARRLVLDESLAEDVLQDTWVAALERGAPADGRGGPRAWLAAVARNLALRRRRREALRAAAERAAARPETIEGDGGDGAAERMRLQRVLVDAVLALDEPYRSAVILRHLDGLSAAAIARRQGCTDEAARQRVSRGLAQLRRHFARRHGRADDCLALAPLLGHGWNAALTGGILVSTKLVLGAVGVGLVALALWMTTAGDRRGDRGRIESAAAQRVAGAAASEPAAERATGSAASDALAAPPTAPESTSPEPARAEVEPAATERPEVLAIRGRIIDTSGRPLQGAELRLVGEQQPLALESDSGGLLTAEIAFPLRGDEQQLHAACEGYVARELALDLRAPFEIELLALPALAGRLVDPRGGEVAPPGYVKAFVLDALTRERREAEAELAADGTYRIEGLPLGRLVSVEARARGFGARTLPLDRELEPDRTLALDVELDPGAVVTGTVLDVRTREPVAGATVWLETFSPEEDSVHPVTTADAEGRFRLVGANVDVQFQDGLRVVFFRLVATADGYAATPTRVYGSDANDRHAYDFEMLLEPAGCALALEIVLADERAARGATVWAIDSQGNPFFESADEEGFHRFDDLPAGPLGLWLAWEGVLGEGEHESGTYDVTYREGRLQLLERGRHALRVDLELAAGETRTERFVLRPPGAASVAGRVVDLHGRGVPDFPVRCQLNFQMNNLMLASGWDETRTDADGRYRFEGLHAGKYQVWASGEGTALACAQPGSTYVEIAADGRAEVEDLLVGACLTIEGRVDAGSHALGELELAARDPASGAALAGTRPEADGSFRFEPLVARDYEVVLLRGEKMLDRATVGPDGARGLFLRGP